ncbi:MAG: cellulase family glycosylhydrolase [Deltaproteobacteria bacterium]|nr:cellulase family glycosylhydrolase [Deltaproteobacteria bacterium]
MRTRLACMWGLRFVTMLACVMACGGDNDPGRGQDWRFITDEEGRALVLHGTGVSNSAKAHGHPWVTREHVLAMSKEWGFNFVRYLIFWIKVEPQPGTYDEKYLDEVKERLDWFAEAGIHVVLDMHQDLWGPSLNCLKGEIYNGAPAWATITDGLERKTYCEDIHWAAGYLSPDVTRAFENFFEHDGDHPELQDRYAAMWAHVAERFKDHPAVLGYDLMNEPWYHAELEDAAVDRTHMHAFIHRMIGAIRAVDSDSWILFEPRAWGPNQGYPSFIPPLKDPRKGAPRLGYIPHIYLFDKADLPSWVESRRAEVEALKMPLVVGEWGLESDPVYARSLLGHLDDMMAGWAQYAYEGPFSPDELDAMVRVFPQRIAGRPLGWKYDPGSRVFTLDFETKAGVTGPTEIYIPAARRYPSGWTLSVSDPDGAWSSEWDEGREILRVFTDRAQARHTVTITPK